MSIVYEYSVWVCSVSIQCEYTVWVCSVSIQCEYTVWVQLSTVWVQCEYSVWVQCEYSVSTVWLISVHTVYLAHVINDHRVPCYIMICIHPLSSLLPFLSLLSLSISFSPLLFHALGSFSFLSFHSQLQFIKSRTRWRHNEIINWAEYESSSIVSSPLNRSPAAPLISFFVSFLLIISRLKSTILTLTSICLWV